MYSLSRQFLQVFFSLLLIAILITLCLKLCEFIKKIYNKLRITLGISKCHKWSCARSKILQHAQRSISKCIFYIMRNRFLDSQFILITTYSISMHIVSLVYQMNTAWNDNVLQTTEYTCKKVILQHFFKTIFYTVTTF